MTSTSTDGFGVFGDLCGVRDALSVRRVFGEPYTVDGTTVIPVARTAGVGGGGGGEGTSPDDSDGHGFGSAFGIGARPVGVYRVRDGEVRWTPTVDVDRLLRGTQILVGVVAVCTALVLRRRRR